MIELDVEGRPAPKGSRTRGTSKNGNSWTRPASKYEKPWVDAVKAETQIVMRHHLTPPPPYHVALEFRLHKPRQGRHDWPPVPDLDKLARAVIDGLVLGGAMEDDRHVTSLTASKRYARSDEIQGVHATITNVAASAHIAA